MGEQTFGKVLGALIGLAVFYGAAVTLLLLTLDHPSDALVTRFIAGFGTIFAGVLGFVTGYLASRRNGNHRNGS